MIARRDADCPGEPGSGMTKAKAKAKSRGKKTTGSAMGSEKQVDLDGLRRKIANLVGGKALWKAIR